MSKISNLIFHNKRHYITQKFSNKHKAVDYGTYRKKIKQYAIEEGIVTFTGLITGAKAVKIKYPRINKEFMHAHLDKILVKKGQMVSKNTAIGTTGMRGIATGMPLHLRIKDLKTNKMLDPEEYSLAYEADNHIYYIVKRKDNLTKIARKYKMTWQELYRKNKEIIGSNPNLIRVGQKLLIK